ncbi:ankyrin repeat [Fusarium tjaetaba]|uniref:Ankyrin repeat n=1 Tax=Fusarium tjaetaba TaxID=1567544 RepID=A0A8H5RG95_9HYPO|nr:ankyrin repeat [Fusarium tjaetaba]KAF5632503.1 ankyrin repeat [Fusarium tjaetaba]
MSSLSSNHSSDDVHEIRNSGTDEPVESASTRFLTTDSARCADGGSDGLINLMLDIEADYSSQVNCKDGHERTPLHIAAEHGMLEIVRKIINFDSRTLHAKDKNKRQPLHVACREGKTETARLFLDAGADIEAEQNQEITALDDAAYHGHTDVVNLLLDTGANVDVADCDGLTPLHNASSEGHIEVVRSILKHPKTPKTTINAQDKSGWAALHMAIWEDYRNTVSFLLEEGADLTLKTSDGWTPLLTATPRYLDMVRIILRYRDKRDIQLEADYEEGYTALLEASRKSQLATTRILIEAGANRKAQDKYGRTGLHLASKTGYVDMLKLFFPLLNGEMIEHQCDGSNTALHLACGARDDSDNSSDSSCVFVIREWEHQEGQHGSVIQFLLDNGADKHAKNDAGDTPLHDAAASGISSRLEPLLKVVTPKDMLAQNSMGWTALRSAYLGEDREIAMTALLKSEHLQTANFGAHDVWLDAVKWAASNPANFPIAKLLVSKRPNSKRPQSLPSTDDNLIESAANQLIPDLLLILIGKMDKNMDKNLDTLNALQSALKTTLQAIQDGLEGTTAMDTDRNRLKVLWVLMATLRGFGIQGLVDRTLRSVKNTRDKLQELASSSLLKDSLNTKAFGPRHPRIPQNRYRVAGETHHPELRDAEARETRLSYLAELEDILRDPPRTQFQRHFQDLKPPEIGSPAIGKLLQRFEATITLFLEDKKCLELLPGIVQ